MKKIGKSKINYYEVFHQILHFALLFAWRHRWRHRSTTKILDNIFLKTTVFKDTKLLDSKHNNQV